MLYFDPITIGQGVWVGENCGGGDLGTSRVNSVVEKLYC